MRLGQAPPPQNTSGGRLPAYSRLRATNLISFQTGNLWLTGTHLFLGMASASSRWKSDRLRPPAITATFTAWLLTRVPSKLWLAQLMHGLLPCSIIITDFTLRVPYHTGYFELCAVALHSFSSPCPLKNKLGAFSKPPRHRAQRLPARTVWYPLSQLHPTSHSWPGPGPKTFPFSFLAQCDLNNRSHLICFHHGSKETVFHFMRSQVRETS